MNPIPHPAFTLFTAAVAASVGFYVGVYVERASASEKPATIVKPADIAVAEVAAVAEPDMTAETVGEKNSAGDGEWEDESGESSDDGESSDESDVEGVNKYADLEEDCKMVRAVPQIRRMAADAKAQVFVVRTDLGMTKGKIAAQCGHATLMCYKAATRHAPNLVRRWEVYGQTKVAVQSRGGEDELLMLQATALSLGVVAKIVHDAGRTQIAAGSATVLGLGPGMLSSWAGSLFGGANGVGFRAEERY